jgi:predicted ATPase
MSIVTCAASDFPSTQSADHISVMLHETNQERIEIDKILKSLSTERGATLLLLHGPTGSGKTTLLGYLKERAKALNTSYGTGSFECNYFNANQPQTAIRQSFQNLMEIVTKSSSWKSIQRKLAQSSFPDYQILQLLFPEFKTALPESDSALNIASEYLGRWFTAPRFHTAFRNLLQVISGPLCPIILVLDNLDFADLDSLQLIQAITTGKELSHLLIVLACNDETNCDTILSSIQNPWSLKKIEVKNLSSKELSSYIVTKYGLKGHDLDRFNSYVFQCTSGNRYQVKMLLSHLEAKNRLRKNEKGRWIWEHVEDEAEFANYTTYLQMKELQRIDQTALLFLQAAALIQAL